MADVWRTLTRCPACTGFTHLSADMHATGRRSRVPAARLAPHDDGWGAACILSRRWAPVWDESTTRAAVAGRSMGVCEYCRERLATDKHHRISRGVGGKWTPANIIDLCRLCHMFCDGNTRADAVGVGLVLDRADNPEWVPVNTPFGDLWLTDDVTGEREEPQPTRAQRKRRIASRAQRASRGRKLR